MLSRKYQVIPIEQDSVMGFSVAKLAPYAEAYRDGMPFYLAGEVDPRARPLRFVIGDNTSGNPPLEAKQKYDVIVGIISELNGVRPFPVSVHHPILDSAPTAHST